MKITICIELDVHMIYTVWGIARTQLKDILWFMASRKTDIRRQSDLALLLNVRVEPSGQSNDDI
jgi:hypothetical protein